MENDASATTMMPVDATVEEPPRSIVSTDTTTVVYTVL